MNILFLTQYYPPEVGAPQNRLHDLAVRLKKQQVNVEVLTAMPNYPQMEIHEGYKRKFFMKDHVEGVKVYRSWIYTTKSKGVFKRLLNYFSFVFSSFWIGWFKTKKYDYILCESPPLFLGITAYLLCKIKRAKLIFNVSDLWPESAEKLGIVENKFFLKLAYKLEKFLYKKAYIITGQTKGIVDNINQRFPTKNPYWLPNGVDLNYFDPDKTVSDWREKNGFDQNDALFLYAGILGHAQGLEVILHAAHEIKNDQAKFIFVGSGPEKQKLLKLKEKLGIENVFFFDAVPKKEILKIIKSIDVTIVPLKKLDLFKGAIPSKIFENLAMKKALILGVDGEAKELFIDQGKAGLYFEPENHMDLAEKINLLNEDRSLIESLGSNGRDYVSEFFDRSQIAQNFISYLNNKNA